MGQPLDLGWFARDGCCAAQMVGHVCFDAQDVLLFEEKGDDDEEEDERRAAASRRRRCLAREPENFGTLNPSQKFVSNRNVLTS